MNHIIVILIVIALITAGCAGSANDAKRQVCRDAKNTCDDLCNTQPESESCKAKCDGDYYICGN